MFIQFNGEIADADQLLAELRLAGIQARSVRTSRWVRSDPDTALQSDAGGRIDIELKHEAWPEAASRIAALEAFMRLRLG